MTDVLIREGEDTETQRYRDDSHVKIGAEWEGCCYNQRNVQDCWLPRGAGRDKEGSSLHYSCQSEQCLDFRLLAPRTVRD